MNRAPVRLRRTLGTFLAWGHCAPAIAVGAACGLVIPAAWDVGLTRPIVITSALALAISAIWMSGRTLIVGDQLITGSRLRPIVFERSEIDHVERVPMWMGRWGTDGLALQRFGAREPTPLRFSGGLRPARKRQWEEAIWSWLLEAEGPFRPPVFAGDATLGDLVAFRRPADARRHAERNAAIDGTRRYWDARGHRLRHLPGVDADERSLIVTDHVDADQLRERLLDVLRTRIWEEATLDDLSIAERRQLAADHLAPAPSAPTPETK